MKLSKYFNSILLGYLVLILNFGPSFHRAPIFGLHDHGTVSVEAEVVCSCGLHHHAPVEQDQDDSQSQDFGSIEKQLCDCSLCKFFKQYNASVDTADFTIAETDVSMQLQTISSLVSRTAYATDARGPPVA